MNLFNFSPPAEDEFSLTYLLRIAQMNGISNLNHFFNNVVFDIPCSICSAKDISYSGSYTGMEFPVNKLIQCLPTGDVAQLDSSRFLMEHTLFPLFSPFFGSDSQKEEFIHKYCSYSGYISAMEFIKCNRKCLYLCPSCMLDDKNKYGFPYVHRIHQAPGVYVCPIHHKPLVLSSFGKSMDPFEQPIEKKPNPYMDTALADQYAVFCKELLENPLPYCASVLEEAVCNTLDHILTTPARKRYLLHAAEDTGLVEGIDYYQYYKKRTGSYNPTDEWYWLYSGYSNARNEYGLVALFLLYGTVSFAYEMIEKRGKPTKIDKARIIIRLLSDEYEINNISLEPGKTNLWLRHKACGQVSHFTLHQFMHGERCSCRANDTENIEDMLLQNADSRITIDNTLSNGKLRVCDQDYVINREHFDMTRKELLQELTRPTLSPLFELSRFEKYQARIHYRADQLSPLIEDALESYVPEDKKSIHKEIYSMINRMLPQEDNAVVTYLARKHTALWTQKQIVTKM